MKALIADFIPYTLQERVFQASKTSNKTINSIKNSISSTTQNIINNNTTVNEGNVDKIEINGRMFFWEKGFDNTTNSLEVGDVIFDNYWNRYTFVKKWQYLGGIKELRTSWEEIETLDFTPEET